MKLRRIKGDLGIRVQVESSGQWISVSRVDQLRELAAKRSIGGEPESNLLAALQLGRGDWDALKSKLERLEPDSDHNLEVCLPFAPASFRDFMLFEQHVIDSTRGYVKKFMPGTYRIAHAVERLTGKPFKKFRPHPLWYEQPIYYLSNHLNFGVSGDCVVWPDYSQALDYELELGAVLAQPLYNATPEEAVAAIGGFVVLNDFSARDVQKNEMKSGFGPQKAKHFFSTMSSTLVTADEILPQINALTGSVSINNETVSRCDTSGMYHSLGEAIAFASRSECLHPGELFGSGTLPGGSGMESGNWLRSGDTLTLKIDQIGELTNTVHKPQKTGSRIL